jgi:hypothetical protein
MPTLKNISEHLRTTPEDSAEKSRGSLNSEILARLERELAAPTVDPEAHALELKTLTAKLPEVEHARVGHYKRQGRV